jgi:hypothetical protein
VTPEEELKKQIDKVKKDPRIIVKGATKLIVGACVSTVAVTIVNTLVPKDTLDRKHRIQLSVAAWAMGGLAADRASEWAANDSLFSTIADGIMNPFVKAEEASEEPTEEKIEEPTK